MGSSPCWMTRSLGISAVGLRDVQRHRTNSLRLGLVPVVTVRF